MDWRAEQERNGNGTRRREIDSVTIRRELSLSFPPNPTRTPRCKMGGGKRKALHPGDQIRKIARQKEKLKVSL